MLYLAVIKPFTVLLYFDDTEYFRGDNVPKMG